MGLKRFNNSELTSVIKAAGTLQFDDDMLLDRTSQQLMLSIHKMSADELYNLVQLPSIAASFGSARQIPLIASLLQSVPARTVFIKT